MNGFSSFKPMRQLETWEEEFFSAASLLTAAVVQSDLTLSSQLWLQTGKKNTTVMPVL